MPGHLQRSSACKRRQLLGAILCALGSELTHAADDNTLPAINVEASAVREDLQASSTKNPYRVESTGQFGTETLTRDDIEALAPKDVFDLLDKATGMNLTYQGRKSPYFLDERGGGNMTYILDGAILPSSANRILQKIPLAAIEQIQVVRGSTSLALGPSIPIGSSNSGSGINTGFVIIRTRRPSGTEATVTGYVERASNQPTANGQSMFLGKTFGDHSTSGYLGGMASRMDTPSKETWFDGQNAHAHMLTGGFATGGLSVNGMSYQDKGRFEMQRGVTVTGELDNSKWYYDPLRTRIWSLDASMDWGAGQTTILQLFKTDYDQSETNASFATSTVTYRKFSENTSGYSLRHNAQFGDTLLQFGRQLTRNDGYGPNLSASYNNWKIKVGGWSVGVEQKLLDGSVTLDAGYREDQKEIDYSATAASRLSANAGQDMAPARTKTLGARWAINPVYALNARYFNGDEGTSGDFDIVTQSGEALHPTRQERTEVALEAGLMPEFQPTLTLFNVDIRNQKTATTNTYEVDGETYYYYTESDALRRGLELLIKGEIGGHTHYSFAWTHMIRNATRTDGDTTNAVGVSSPANLFTARLGHSWGAYQANLSVKRVSAWEQSTSAMGTAYDVNLGDYTRVDANVMRRFRVDEHAVTVKLYGRNLTDDHYATRYTTGYYYDRGRTLGVELTASF